MLKRRTENLQATASREREMTDQMPTSQRSIAVRYGLWGFVLGLLFPVVATWLEVRIQGLPADMGSMVAVQRSNPLLWIIDLAPFILGPLATLVGNRQDRLIQLNEKLSARDAQMQMAQEVIEERVAERTAELQRANEHLARRAAQLSTITQVSESIAQLHDLNEILPATASLISERFGFYHVGIFLVDRDREYAVLRAVNSEGGRRMLERNHRLAMGVGVVGHCAQTGQPHIALDVGADAGFFNNPELPDTRSEVAIPMKLRAETIGVLDVQSTEAGAFSNEDLQVLAALANQVTIALENTRLLTESRAALTQVQEVYNEFTRAEWTRTVSRAERHGVRFQTGRVEMLESPLQNPEVALAIEQGEVMTGQGNEARPKQAAVAVPVKLRGEVIGVLHVESNDPEKLWQDDEISLVQAVAERAAFAMENARLFQDARRRAEKERLISEASARIGGALNIENILQTTAEELERVLGGSEISIQFQTKEQS
jgi:GAF domain-containing protein